MLKMPKIFNCVLIELAKIYTTLNQHRTVKNVTIFSGASLFDKNKVTKLAYIISIKIAYSIKVNSPYC